MSSEDDLNHSHVDIITTAPRRESFKRVKKQEIARFYKNHFVDYKNNDQQLLRDDLNYRPGYLLRANIAQDEVNSHGENVSAKSEDLMISYRASLSVLQSTGHLIASLSLIDANGLDFKDLLILKKQWYPSYSTVMTALQIASMQPYVRATIGDYMVLTYNGCSVSTASILGTNGNIQLVVSTQDELLNDLSSWLKINLKTLRFNIGQGLTKNNAENFLVPLPESYLSNICFKLEITQPKLVEPAWFQRKETLESVNPLFEGHVVPDEIKVMTADLLAQCKILEDENGVHDHSVPELLREDFNKGVVDYDAVLAASRSSLQELEFLLHKYEKV